MSTRTSKVKPTITPSKKRKVSAKVKQEKPFVPQMIDLTAEEEGLATVITAPVAPNPFRKT